MTADLTITLDEAPDAELREAILRPLRAFNTAQAGPFISEPLAIFLRDPATDEIIGGIWAVAAGNWLYIDLLFVPEERRGRGLGRDLMARAETIAAARGYMGIRLDTASFQAPGFYEKLGYKVYGTLPGYPGGHTQTLYCKMLDSRPA